MKLIKINVLCPEETDDILDEDNWLFMNHPLVLKTLPPNLKRGFWFFIQSSTQYEWVNQKGFL